MRIGVSTAAYYGVLETERAAKKLADLSLPCCEVFLQSFSEYHPAFGQVVKRMLGDMPVVSVHSKTLHFEGDFIASAPRQRADGFEMLESFLKTGEVMGAKYYVYHGPPRLRGGKLPAAKWEKAIEEAMELCRKHGMELAWEIVSWAWLTTPECVREFSRIWPQLHFVLDVKQGREIGFEPEEYVDAMGEKLCHIHILDTDGHGKHALPGHGISDFRNFSSALKANGYQGDMILEPYGGMLETDEMLINSVRWLQEHFQ